MSGRLPLKDSRSSRTSIHKLSEHKTGHTSRKASTGVCRRTSKQEQGANQTQLSLTNVSAIGAPPSPGSVRGLLYTASYYNGQAKPWYRRHLIPLVTLFALLMATCTVAVYIGLRYFFKNVVATTPLSQFTCAYDETQLSVELKSLGATVRGRFIYGGTLRAFFGIPYGADTAGKNRFGVPKNRSALSEDGVFNASEHGPRCPQDVATGRHISEDCLTLSIWAPVQCNKTSAPYVVLVVLSSKWFQRGYVEEYENMWEVLSASGKLVVVFINHRVGILGFLDAGVGDAPGNVGIYDAFLALSWIKEHIHAFGGDPNFLVGLGDGSGSYILSLDLFAEVRGRKRVFKRLLLNGIFPSSMLPNVGPFSSILASFQCDRGGDVESSIACLRDIPLSQMYKRLDEQKPRLFMPSYDKPPVVHCGDMLSELPTSLESTEMLCGYSIEDAAKLFDRYVLQQAMPPPKEPSVVFELLQRFFTGKSPRHEFKNLPLEALHLLNESTLQGFRDLVADIVLRCPLLRFVQNAVLKGMEVYMYALEARSGVFESALTKEEIVEFAKTGKTDWKPFSYHSSVLVITRTSRVLQEWGDMTCVLAESASRSIFR